MSWQDSVDNNLVGTGFVSQGAICGLDGSVWASSPGLNVSANEIKAIVNVLTGASNSESLAGFFFVASTKYVLQAVIGRSIYGRAGDNGIVVAKTNQVVILGRYDSSMQPGSCAAVVEALADYFDGMGY